MLRKAAVWMQRWIENGYVCTVKLLRLGNARLNRAPLPTAAALQSIAGMHRGKGCVCSALAHTCKCAATALQ